MSRKPHILLTFCALMGLAACSQGDPSLMNLRANQSGPDEFAILPTRPIEIPTDLAALPEPTPGGTNRTDPTPEADAIAALGGNAARGGGVTNSLLAHATRFGIEEGIRDQLATEDLAFRRDNDGRLLERVFGVNVYYRAYRPISLDRYAELERLRRAGIRTPAAPPEPQPQ